MWGLWLGCHVAVFPNFRAWANGRGPGASAGLWFAEQRRVSAGAMSGDSLTAACKQRRMDAHGGYATRPDPACSLQLAACSLCPHNDELSCTGARSAEEESLRRLGLGIRVEQKDIIYLIITFSVVSGNRAPFSRCLVSTKGLKSCN